MSGGSAAIRSSPSTTSTSFATRGCCPSCAPSRARHPCASPACRRRCLDSSPGRDVLHHPVGVEPVVPGVEHPRLGGPEHPLAIAAHDGEVDLAPLLVREPAIAAGDLEARGEPLHVPFPRAGQRLVEVVDVEDQRALGGAEHAEVRQVRVTADLRGDARGRRAGEVGGHQQRGAAIERERRHHHARVPDRHEFLHPRGRLLLEERDRVGAIGRRRPPLMAGPWRAPPRLASDRRAIGEFRGGVRDLRRRGD